METYSNIKVKFIPRIFRGGAIRGSVTTKKFVDEEEVDQTYSFSISKTHGKDVTITFKGKKPQWAEEIKAKILKEYKRK